MALSIGVRVGDRIQVGTNTVKVTGISKPNLITISVKGKTVYITDTEAVEILPEVFVSSGLSDQQYERNSRLAFEAPRSIHIERIKPAPR